MGLLRTSVLARPLGCGGLGGRIFCGGIEFFKGGYNSVADQGF